MRGELWEQYEDIQDEYWDHVVEWCAIEDNSNECLITGFSEPIFLFSKCSLDPELMESTYFLGWCYKETLRTES